MSQQRSSESQEAFWHDKPLTHIPGTPSRDEQMSKIYLHTYVGALRSDWLPLWLIRGHHQRSCKLSSPVNHLIRAHSWLQKHWLTLSVKRELLSSHCWVLVCDITEHLFFQCKLPQVSVVGKWNYINKSNQNLYPVTMHWLFCFFAFCFIGAQRTHPSVVIIKISAWTVVKFRLLRSQ